MSVAPSIFAGIKVLDLTKVYSGPLATRYLADYGAHIIKIENPLDPDPARSFPPLKNGASGYFEILNRNKQSLCLDLMDAKDLKTFYNQVKTCDVIVENMTPSAKFKLKIDYDTLKKINPKIIYASLCGKNQQSNDKYFDVIAQAESGLISLSGTPDKPTKIGPAVVDAFSGINLAFAISSALYYREKNGVGQNLNVSMLASAMNMLEQNLIDYSVTGNNPTRIGNHDNAIAPFGIYDTVDSRIVLAIGSDNLWQTFTNCFENYPSLKELDFETNEQRLKNQPKLTKLIETIFAKFTTSEILTILKIHNIPSSKINEMSDIAHDDWFFKNGALQKIQHPILGECVVPGHCIDFSTQAEYQKLKLAPVLTGESYNFKPINESNLPELTNLLNTCFNIKNKDKDKLIYWKYFDQKFRSSTCAYGAFTDKKIVSFYSNKQTNISDKDHKYQSGICLDMCTLRDYRGEKLISRLSKLTYTQRENSNFDFTFGFSNKAGIKIDKNSKNYDYSIVGQFARYVAFTKPTNTDLNVSVGTKLRDWPSLSLLHFTQSAEYLSWRYIAKPNNEYQILDISDIDGKLIAQAIVITSKTKLEIFKIIANKIEDVSAIISSLRDYAFTKEKIILIIRVLPNKYWSQILKENNFTKFSFREIPYYLTVKHLPNSIAKKEYLTDPESWFLMGGDVL